MKSHDDFITTRAGGFGQNCAVKTWHKRKGRNEMLLRFHNNLVNEMLVKSKKSVERILFD
jgi:hypothetical protein